MTAQADASVDFRRALSHYPTGVTLVTSHVDGADPAAMVVGTFTSVSLDPPLVGFLVDHRSTTWPTIRNTGRFAASVLRADDESVCRAFATKAEGRFDHLSAITNAGNPRLDDAALWVDCDIESVLPAGDHDFVLGRVRELGVGVDGGLPLIFLRGGYGAPQIASLQAEEPGLGSSLDLADLVRPEIESVARDLKLECAVTVAVDGAVVCIAAAGIGSPGLGALVGAQFPLAAPMAPHFVAGATVGEQEAWIEAGSRLTGQDVSAWGSGLLEAVRGRDYVAATGRRDSEQFQAVIASDSRLDSESPIADIFKSVAARGIDPGLTRPIEDVADVVSLHAPVRDTSGTVLLCLDLLGLQGDESADRLAYCRDRLLEAAGRASLVIGAHLPF